MTRTVLTLCVLAAAGFAAYYAISKLQLHVQGTVGGLPVNANLSGGTGGTTAPPSDQLAQQIGSAGGAAAGIITAIGGAFASSNGN